MTDYVVGEFVVFAKNQTYFIAIITGEKDGDFWPVFITVLNKSTTSTDDYLFKIDWDRKL